MRSAGTVMGVARESFGTGGGVALAPATVGAGPGNPVAAGWAADRSVADSNHVGSHVALLGEHDQLGGQQLSGAIAAAGAGRNRMDGVIAAAVADVEALGVSTDTPQGQRALVDAVKRHLEDTKTTVDTAGADASTKAAAANTTTAGYNGVGSPATPPITPAQGMGAMIPAMGGMPSMGGGGLPLGSLASLAGMAKSLPGAAPVAGGASGDVPGGAEPAGDSQHLAPLIHGDKRSVARYVFQAARARGYSAEDATAVVAYALGESSLNPTISGGPQGGSGSADTVIGLFQEKPQFARDGGVDPAQRYTVEGNTTAYLNQLVQHRGAGDIYHQLFATSKGGPFYTGGYAAMKPLMGQARQLLGGGEGV